MSYVPVRGISKAVSNLLRPASKDSRTILNFWKPGYKIEQTVKTKSGQEKRVKIFTPTSTTEAALSFLIKYYGSDQYLKFKDDVHPGHCSIETHGKQKKQYLSIGTSEEFDAIGFTTHHELIYTDNFIKDVLAFKRFPDKRFDFYTLNAMEINELIEIFKKEKNVYSLLGDRLFGFTEGESCATFSYRCLKRGGIDELLTPYRSAISSQIILTPALLADYAELARTQESSVNKSHGHFYEEFQEESEALKGKLQELIKKEEEIEAQAFSLDSDENQQGSSKPKSKK